MRGTGQSLDACWKNSIDRLSLVSSSRGLAAGSVTLGPELCYGDNPILSMRWNDAPC